MNIKDDTLYILVEGEPNSPEIEAFGRLLSSDINTVNYEFIEIGGSGNFNTVAKMIYNKAKKREFSIHKQIPVLAISDRDFCNSLDDDNLDSDLIKKNKAKIIYWERHEWENFLLDEIDIITSFLNQLPIKSSNNKPAKQVTDIIQKEIVNNFLLKYFQSQIQTEFIECIRFRFLRSGNLYPRLEAPKDIQGVDNLKKWYTSQIVEQSQTCKDKIESCSTIFDEVLKEYNWKNWIEEPQNLSLEDAKKYFRGKEAFTNLFKYLLKEFKIIYLNENVLKERILRDLENSQNSILVTHLNKLLSPYLEKAKESSG